MKKTLFGSLALISVGAAVLTVACGPSTSSSPDEFANSQLYGSDLPNNTITLTFDDGPAGRTRELGDFLAGEGIKATFFMQGSNIPGNENTLARLRDQGHLVANHTYSHPQLTRASDPVAEVRRTDTLIAPYVLGNIFLFRAPYGDWASRVASVLNATSLRKYVGTVFWDIGGDMSNGYAADWACWSQGYSVTSCGDRYIKEIRAKKRGIVLLHDVHSKTVDMVKYMVPKLKDEGFRFVRLDAVPNLAQRIRNAGGTPNTDTPVVRTLGAIECPETYTLEKVGSEGGQYCTNGTDVWGPFTQAMIDKCRSWGGGDSCLSQRWAKSLALSARGTGACPVGASWDSETTYCVEGTNAFGPFPQNLVQRCISAGGGEQTCRSARWNRDFLARILRQGS